MPAGYPTVRPLQMLDFANQAKVDSRFTFSRTTAGSFVNASGLQETASANVPRPSYDSLTGQYLGLLMEAASTNLLPWSNNLAASGWYYAPQNGPLTSGYTGIGGQSTAYRISEGTVPGQWYVATSVPITGTFAPASYTKINYAASAFIKSDGVNRGYLQFFGIDASGIVKGNIVSYFDLRNELVYPENFGTNTLAASLDKRTNGWYRIGAIGPMSSGVVLGILNLVLQADNGSLFYSGASRGLLTDGFQVENNAFHSPIAAPNAFVSSFIATSGAAITRAVDALESNSNQLNDWYIANSGLTICQDAILRNRDMVGDGARIVTSFTDGGTFFQQAGLHVDSNNSGIRIIGFTKDNNVAITTSAVVVSGGIDPWEIVVSGGGNWYPRETSRNVYTKTAFTFASSGMSLAYNGTTFSSVSSGYVASGITRFLIRPFSHGRMILRRATIWPTLSDETMRLITGISQ